MDQATKNEIKALEEFRNRYRREKLKPLKGICFPTRPEPKGLPDAYEDQLIGGDYGTEDS